jgi:hypothetical protein
MKARRDKGEITPKDYARFEKFIQVLNRDVMTHPVITDNRYTKWFAKGDASFDDVKHFIQQFSVFSNMFLIAQLLKTINATSLEGMRASKEILANEIGVIYHPKQKKEQGRVSDPDREGDPDLVSTEGTVDGGTFKFKAAHFEWLLRIGEVLGLTFHDMGKRRHGTPSTLFFCDELARIYGSDDPHIGEGASFAVETWAAAGFWKELIQGLDRFKKRDSLNLPLAFFTWHDRLEDQHADHVMDELEEAFFSSNFDEARFLQGAREMLNGVQAFWTGLNENRLARAAMEMQTIN